MGSAQIQLTGLEEAMAKLSKLEAIAKIGAIEKGLRAASKPVIGMAKMLCPQGGPRTGDKAGKKHLRDTIGFVYRRYAKVEMGIVGTLYPAGAHGHLVEYGHQEVLFGKPTGRRVPPKPFMRPAVDQTRGAQVGAFNDAVSKAVGEAIA